MKKMIPTFLFVALLFGTLAVKPAYAFSLEDLRTYWQQHVLHPLFGFVLPTPSPTPQPLEWKTLQPEEKQQKLDVAKERVSTQIDQAVKTVNGLNAPSIPKQKKDEILKYLDDQKEVIQDATSPAELELDTQDLQRKWQREKTQIKRHLRSDLFIQKPSSV